MKTKGAVAQRKSATAPRFVLLVSINTNLLQHFLRSHIGEQLTAVQAERGPIQSFVLHPAKLYPALFAKLHPALYQRQGRGGRAGSNKLGRQPLLCHNGCLMTVSAKDPINRMILQEPNQAVRSGKVVGIGFRCSRSVYRVVQREDRWAVCGFAQLLLQPRKLAAGQLANDLAAGGIQYDPSEPFGLFTIVQGLIRGQSPKSAVEVLTDIMVSQCGISFRMILLVQLLPAGLLLWHSQRMYLHAQDRR